MKVAERPGGFYALERDIAAESDARAKSPSAAGTEAYQRGRQAGIAEGREAGIAEQRKVAARRDVERLTKLADDAVSRMVRAEIREQVIRELLRDAEQVLTCLEDEG